MPTTDPHPTARLLGVAPHLRVRDLTAAAAFYRDQLGFDHDRLWGNPPHGCLSTRDGLTLVLAQSDDPAKLKPAVPDDAGWDAYVWVSDVELLFAELKRKAVRVVYEPSVTLYDMKEFAVADPDGNVIAFGQHWSGKPAV
jgi:catechol 2,3-dioxygenase-like lactoylglutathione lyase family enzyme